MHKIIIWAGIQKNTISIAYPRISENISFALSFILCGIRLYPFATGLKIGVNKSFISPSITVIKIYRPNIAAIKVKKLKRAYFIKMPNKITDNIRNNSIIFSPC
jgi:hypothetical protein